MLSDGATAFTFNAAGRLSKVVRSGQTNQYYHNATGQRILKSGAYLVNGPYRFVYDSQGRLIGEYTMNNVPRQETVWLDDLPVAVLKKNQQWQTQAYYVHADHLNTPRAIIDQQNRTVWKWGSNAFGQGLPEEDPDGDGQTFEYNPRFPGQYYDKETGLHYNYFRDYDPQTGRYVEADPIGLEGGTNVYGYANQNPLWFTDPLGLFGTSDFVGNYYGGYGNEIDLGNVGLLDDFRNSNSVSGSVARFKRKIEAAVKKKAQSMCGQCDNGTKSERLSEKDRDATDVTNIPNLFSVGDSTFFREAECMVKANCATRQYSYICGTHFFIRDWFRDPLGLGFEAGGTPYRINTDWTGSVTGSGRF